MSLSQLNFLRHILDEVMFIEQAMKNKSMNDIETDLLLQKAVIRSIEVIGEATKRINPAFRMAYPQVDWKAMAGTRDKLIHDYFEVDLELVYDIIVSHIPSLKIHLLEIIQTESGNNNEEQ
jgi:uncharacterized protein with HEPN domain